MILSVLSLDHRTEGVVIRDGRLLGLQVAVQETREQLEPAEQHPSSKGFQAEEGRGQPGPRQRHPSAEEQGGDAADDGQGDQVLTPAAHQGPASAQAP